MSLSAGIAQEPVSITPRLMVQRLSALRLRKPAASSWTARWSSIVDDAIKLVCAGVAYKARAAISGLSGQRHGPAGAAFAHPRAADRTIGSVRSFSTICKQMYEATNYL